MGNDRLDEVLPGKPVGFDFDPELEKANSGLEFIVGFPKMDKMAAQGNIILGDAERNLTHCQEVSPVSVILHPQALLQHYTHVASAFLSTFVFGPSPQAKRSR